MASTFVSAKRRGIFAVLLVACVGANARAQKTGLSLGYAVDTTAVPASWWGVDAARSALPSVVRTWRDFLAVRKDTAKRVAFWSSADRQRLGDPDLLFLSEGYILDADPTLVEAQPVIPRDSTRWLLRTLYLSGGSKTQPGVLGMERIYVGLENGRWVLYHASSVETASWMRERVGPIEYVVHPSLTFNRARAMETAQWVQETARRFGVGDVALITYYQTPNLQEAFRVMGLELALSADRVGGRASPAARVVFAADPRFGEAYRHEIAHVLLQSIAGGRSGFVGEGIAYWLGGARGQPFAEMMRDLAAYLDRHHDPKLADILDTEGSGTWGSARLPAAAAVIELVFRRSGDAGVRRFIGALGTQEPKLDAVARAVGVSSAELEQSWRALVRSFAAPSASR